MRRLILVVLVLWNSPFWASTGSVGEDSLENRGRYKVTAYCPCSVCCGKWSKIRLTASGKVPRVGMVACNWMRFGQVIEIEGMGRYVVEDRGAVSQFGSNKNKIKHIDVYMPTHKEALKFGVQHRKVKICTTATC
jgi:3D (Asp-Asp-Asp) domain-containing protein